MAIRSTPRQPDEPSSQVDLMPKSAASVGAAESPSAKGLLGVVVAVVVVAALWVAHDVLVPITLAVLLSFVLSPIVDGLHRLGLWRGPSVFVAVLLALGLVGGTVTLVGSQVASLSADAPRYARTLQAKVEQAQAVVTERAEFLTRALEKRERQPVAAAPTIAPNSTDPSAVEPVAVRLVAPATSPLELIQSVLSPVLAPFETFVIVLVVAIFILAQKEDLRDRFIRLFGSSDLHRTTLAIDDATSRLARYFLSQLAVNSGFGLVIGIGLWLIGVPVPALWGLLAGVLRFVPYVGALLGAALPLALAAAVDPGWSLALYVALLFVIIEPLIGYVLEPLLYGHSTGLSPLSVILAAVFWTWIWGPVGLILSMPLTLCLVVLGRHVPALEFLDVLLGDRPALTPVEMFYQRLLAQDPDEALEQAEGVLKDRSLAAYYDEVALEGLKLTAEDERRGVIDAAGVARIARAMLAIVNELDHHDDGVPVRATTKAPLDPVANDPVPVAEVAPPPMSPPPPLWRDAGSIMCVAGRGPLDDVVTAMLAQLLAKRGFGTERVTQTAVDRDVIERLDVSRTEMICLSYLELGGTPAHLRYLVRRLRRRAPDAIILVGLWPHGEAALSDQAIQRQLGADLYVGSLHDAVSACHRMANELDPHGVAAA